MQVKLKTYNILSDAIEVGIEAGYNRAHKHTDTPSKALITQEIHRFIMLQLVDVIDFDNE